MNGHHRHLGEIERPIKHDGKEYYIMSSVNIDGSYVENNLGAEQWRLAMEYDLVYPANACTKASEEDAAYYEAHRYEH